MKSGYAKTGHPASFIVRFIRFRNVMRMPLSIQNPTINVPYFLISK